MLDKFNDNFFDKDDLQIFKFINPDSNDKLSEMSGYDLQEFIVLIDNFYMELRKKLGFDESVTFGLEIEFENAMKKKINKSLRTLFPGDDIRCRTDDSLIFGAEISSPILKDEEETWKNLDIICNMLNSASKVGKNSGGHIHIGTQVLGSDRKSWLNFLKIWSVYENIIFRFSYGNFLSARPCISRYAMPIAKSLWDYYEKLNNDNSSLDKIIYSVSGQKYQAVNFNNIFINKCDDFYQKNTIEFRCPNGSLDSVIWQNNVNLFVNLLNCCRNSTFDDDLVDKKYDKISNIQSNLSCYNEMYLDQVLEFCDMIFSNNYDKVYFLKQYFKSFQKYDKNISYPKIRKLTK